MELITLPIETVVQVAVQFWDILGVPTLLGIVISRLMEWAKFNPKIPFIEKGKTWIIRGFVTLFAVAAQLIFFLIAGREVTWEIVQQIALTYFAASVAYTHLFKVVEPTK